MFSKFQERYEFTKDGKVFNKKTKKELTSWTDKYGYVCYTLTFAKNKKQNIFKHRLILWFNNILPSSSEHKFVNHKDGNPLNNSLKNLEWCTRKENEQHKYKVLQHRRLTLRKFSVEEVKQMRKDYEPNVWHSKNSITNLAKKYGCSYPTMRDILNHKTYNKDKDYL